MRKVFLAFVLSFVVVAAVAQPTNYTRIANRYRWISGMFDSTLRLPSYNGTPVGMRTYETASISGAVAVDTANYKLYFYSGGAWREAGSGLYTASNGITLSGSDFKLGGSLANSTTINGNGKQFIIDTTVSFRIASKSGTDMSAVIGYPTSADLIYYNNSQINGRVSADNTGASIKSQESTGNINSAIYAVRSDSSLLFTSKSKKYKIDSLTNSPGTKSLRYNPSTGLVSYSDTAAGGGFYDTCTLATFSAGAGLAADTAAFLTTSIYGSFYNDGNDTLVITKQMAVLQGSSPSITPTVYWNDSLNVTAGAVKLVNSPSALTNTATGTAVTSFDNYKIPPGVWVWVATPTVGTKPTYFSLSLIGYKKRI